MNRLFRPALLRPLLTTRSYSLLHPTPSPPRLPPAEQAEFERLQRLATSTLTNPNFAPTAPNDSEVAEGGDSETLFKGAKPEFEGERNPRTGEVGGPKNEPLRWGGGSDWSFNGRATDF